MGEVRGADASEGLIQRLITRLYLAGVIWKADPQQVEHFREGAARKTKIGDQPDFNASLDLFIAATGWPARIIVKARTGEIGAVCNHFCLVDHQRLVVLQAAAAAAVFGVVN